MIDGLGEERLLPAETVEANPGPTVDLAVTPGLT